MDGIGVTHGLTRIAQRRAVLCDEIAGQRTALFVTASLLRKEIAYAALGLAAGKLLGRWPWARALVFGATAALAVMRLRRNAAP
jgi:hypothetical protein